MAERTIRLAMVAMAALGAASGAAVAGQGIVHERVYEARASHPDGRVYVAIVLSDGGGASVGDRQQALLDAFADGEFELVHRPEGVPGLTGSVNESGLAKLAAHPAVAAVHLDVMNVLYGIESLSTRERADLEVRSRFILTQVLAARPSGQAGGGVDLAPRPPLGKTPLRAVPGFEHRLVVKFVDSVQGRPLASGDVVSRAGANLDPVRTIATQLGLTFRKLIRIPDDKLRALEAGAATRSGRAQPDLAGIMVVAVDQADTDKLIAAGEALQQLAQVEYAYLEVLGVPPPEDIDPPTPDFFGGVGACSPTGGGDCQTYRHPDEATGGVDFDYAWAQEATGAGVRLSDCEWSWRAAHEDLNDIDLHLEPGQTVETNELIMAHGTAVVGVISAVDNGYGCSGMVPDVTIFTYPE